MATEDIRLAIGDVPVLSAGAGGRPLLLVHGFTGSKEDFADEIDRFAALGFHAVAPDLRGHGDGPKPDDEAAYNLDLFTADMIEIIEALGWSSCDLVGHSMGGMVAQQLVIERPELVDRLVLMDTHYGPVPGLDPSILELGIQIVRTEGMARIRELLTAFNPPENNPRYVRMCEERPGYAEWRDARFVASSAAMYAAMLHQFQHLVDRRDALAAIEHETLVVVGRLDLPFVEPCQVLADTIPNARFEIIEDAGHSPQIEATDTWRVVVDGFLTGTVTDGRGEGEPAGV